MDRHAAVGTATEPVRRRPGRGYPAGGLRRAPANAPALLATLLAALFAPACHGRAKPAGPVKPAEAAAEATSAKATTVVRAEELLVGRFPGVRVIQLPGGGFTVRVWGPSSVTGGQEPLYVVDGVPVHVDPNRGLEWLSPADVESIRVLKDVSETAVWGVRGGNGVVVITTRRRDEGGSG